MLNKEICKKCWQEYYRSENMVDDYYWGEAEIQDWMNGCVLCPETFFARIDEQPPKHCEYILEHVMETQNNVE